MNYEEKYKQALSRAIFYNGELPTENQRKMLVDIFPELADKVEPKFKVGNWIVFNGLVLYIYEIVDGYYRTVDIDGIPCSYDWDIDNIARLWTINDAKDGGNITSPTGCRCHHHQRKETKTMTDRTTDIAQAAHDAYPHETWIFIDGAHWADQHPSTETINKIIGLYKQWYSQQCDIALPEYIKERFSK